MLQRRLSRLHFDGGAVTGTRFRRYGRTHRSGPLLSCLPLRRPSPPAWCQAWTRPEGSPLDPEPALPSRYPETSPRLYRRGGGYGGVGLSQRRHSFRDRQRGRSSDRTNRRRPWQVKSGRICGAIHSVPEQMPEWRVVKEKRATFAATPAEIARRQPTINAVAKSGAGGRLDGYRLAGHGSKGSIRSGHAAAAGNH